MIRLIVTDLDGTLLGADGKLPDDFERTLAALDARGIAFAVASGRYYRSVEEMFRKYYRNIYAVTDNGAYVVARGKVIAKNLLPNEKYRALVAESRKLEDVCMLTCAERGMYYETLSDKPCYAGHNAFYVREGSRLPFSKVRGGVLKIAYADCRNPKNYALPALREFLDGGRYSYMVSSDMALDVMEQGCSKGMGVRKLQEYLGVTPSESAAFGDHENDLSLFEAVKYSFAMENSPDYIKKCARAVCPANTASGVTRTIEKLLEDAPCVKS